MPIVQKPAQVGDEAAGPGDAEAGRDMDDEVVEPGGRVGELVAQILAADEGAVGVPLPAGRAQPQSGMPSQLAALAADSRRLLRRTRA
ncbi:hypothetical protein QQY24_00410 [Streptomyces sp. TG1A-8]|uniref:hypothetical protein n=1 Tax=Streptomyces sp. TG1A-8 TaxID=3051385 RepID=UPI00265C2EB4|nr:hypothetical protein [Streptomyces sp. TG1A-8]MDO0923989.1 hypothetical protein [Streptomyces sp. TG1A-8]